VYTFCLQRHSAHSFEQSITTLQICVVLNRFLISLFCKLHHMYFSFLFSHFRSLSSVFDISMRIHWVVVVVARSLWVFETWRS
jgi:hypothetical protein